MSDDLASTEGEHAVLTPSPGMEKESSELKRLRKQIVRAALAIKDCDLHLMGLDADALGKADRDSLNMAIEGVRLAREILAGRGKDSED